MLLVLLVAVRIGAAFPDAWSRLSPSFVVGVEAGATVWRQRLAVVVDGAFTAPAAEASGSDDASVGAFTARLEVRQTIVGASLVYRHPLGRVVPYIGMGPRLCVFDAHESGTAMGAALPAERELSVGGGVGGIAGVGVRLGPGEAFADVRADAAWVHNQLAGDAFAADLVGGAVFIAGGYRVTF